MSPAAQVIAKSPNDVLCTYDGGVITAGELADELVGRGYPMRVSWDTLSTVPVSQLEDLARQMVLDRILEKQAARDAQWQRPDFIAVDLDKEHARLLQKELYQTIILDKVTTPTDAELLPQYEKNKERYKISFSFTMRHIFLSTYRDYEVKAGDTLESIAQTVIGDDKAVERILSKATKRPRSGSEDGKPHDAFQPLIEGEILLVPMNAKETNAIYERIVALHNKLKDGADFKALAEEQSEAGNKGDEITVTPSAERPMLPEIIEAVRTTSEDAFSQPFQTKHGWQIIQVVRKTEEGYRPFEEVKSGLYQREHNTRARDSAQSYINKLFEESPLLKIHPEALGSKAKPEDVVARVGDVTYTVQDMLLDSLDKGTTPTTVAELRDLLKNVGRVFQPILLDDAKRKGLDKAPRVSREMQLLESRMVAQAYAESIVEKRLADPSEETIAEYYETNKERMFKQPRKLELYVISTRPDVPVNVDAAIRAKAVEEQKKNMEAWKAGIKDLETFKTVARQHSIVKKEEGGYVGQVTTSFDGGIAGALETLQPRQLTGPIEAHNKLYLLWAEDIIPEKIQPLDEVRDRVKQMIRHETRRSTMESLRNEIVGAANFKSLLPGQTPETDEH
jgi:parvulin-like peptidyl-prolyl isomerase